MVLVKEEYLPEGVVKVTDTMPGAPGPERVVIARGSDTGFLTLTYKVKHDRGEVTMGGSTFRTR
jgi:hypothetical protein